jgi:AraC family transcriptional regulator, transcriptional activator FtrA
MPKGSSQPPRGERLHQVAAIVDENSNPFELGCAIEVFGLKRPELGRDLYDFRLCSPEPGTPMRDGLFILAGVRGLEAAESAETLIVPNRPDTDVPRRPAVLQAIRRAHARGARLVGLCTGAFTLAEAGVLDGRRAATHWQWAASFRARFPLVTLEEDVLFVDDGDILTAAGSAAALDLGLHIVRHDYGAEIANSVSRRLVFSANRDGGQKQFIEHPMPAIRDESLAPVLSWALARLDQTITTRDLAAQALVAPATLHRRFKSQLGTTPLAWLTRERVALACRLLERGESSIELVAKLSGLGTATNLRIVMRRQTGLTPSAYREHFGQHHA